MKETFDIFEWYCETEGLLPRPHEIDETEKEHLRETCHLRDGTGFRIDALAVQGAFELDGTTAVDPTILLRMLHGIAKMVEMHNIPRDESPIFPEPVGEPDKDGGQRMHLMFKGKNVGDMICKECESYLRRRKVGEIPNPTWKWTN